jgi:hypothetical protein
MSQMCTFLVAIGLALASVSPASAEIDEENKLCFDLAVIATTPRYRWHPVEVGPDEIVMRSPVSGRFAVEKVISGKFNSLQIRVETALHTRFSTDIKQFLLFLKNEGTGKYSLQEMKFELVYDRTGQLVWPIAAPLASYSWEEGFTPEN